MHEMFVFTVYISKNSKTSHKHHIVPGLRRDILTRNKWNGVLKIVQMVLMLKQTIVNINTLQVN